MTRRKKFELHLALVPVVAAGITALSACAGRLLAGIWPSVLQLLMFFVLLSACYVGLVVYDYLKGDL